MIKKIETLIRRFSTSKIHVRSGTINTGLPTPTLFDDKIRGIKTRNSLKDFIKENKLLIEESCLPATILQYIEIYKLEKRAAKEITISEHFREPEGNALLSMLIERVPKMKGTEITSVLVSLSYQEFKDAEFWKSILLCIQSNEKKLFRNNLQALMKLYSTLFGIVPDEVISKMVELSLHNFGEAKQDSTFKIVPNICSFIYYYAKVKRQLKGLEFSNEIDCDILVQENLSAMNQNNIIQLLNATSYFALLSPATVRLLRDIINLENISMKEIVQLLRACAELDLRDAELTLEIVDQIKKNVRIIKEESEDQGLVINNLHQLNMIYHYLIKIGILDLELLGRIEDIIQSNTIHMSIDQIMRFINHHCRLMRTLIKKHQTENVSEAQKKSSEVLTWKLNRQFWDDMVFHITPRLSEFKLSEIKNLLVAINWPRYANRSIQRIMIGFAVQGIDLANKESKSSLAELLSISSRYFNINSARGMLEDKLVDSEALIKELPSIPPRLQLDNNNSKQ